MADNSTLQLQRDFTEHQNKEQTYPPWNIKYFVHLLFIELFVSIYLIWRIKYEENFILTRLKYSVDPLKKGILQGIVMVCPSQGGSTAHSMNLHNVSRKKKEKKRSTVYVIDCPVMTSINGSTELKDIESWHQILLLYKLALGSICKLCHLH